MSPPSDLQSRQLALMRAVRAWRNGETMQVPNELLESASPGLRLALARLSQRRRRQQPHALTSRHRA